MFFKTGKDKKLQEIFNNKNISLWRAYFFNLSEEAEAILDFSFPHVPRSCSM